MNSLYLVSISAVRELAQGRIEVLSIPVMIYQPSVRDAAAVASRQAFDEWPPEKGYSLHRANVMPLRLNVWEQIAGAMREENLEFFNTEEPKTFACSDFSDDTPIEWPEEIEH